MLSRCSASLVCLLAATAVLATSEEGEDASPPPSLRNLLLCLRREYTLKATRSDPQGRRCWDLITATSCWGRCDSFEIPDWRFPFKISYHPVCVHDQRVLRRVQLRNCDPGADPELRVYEFYEAVSCACKVCNSSDTFCDWRNHLANHHSHHQHHNNHHHHKNSHHHHRDD